MPIRASLAFALLLAADGAPLPAHAGSATIVESKFELFVTDVEASVRFYEALGFRVADRQGSGYTTLASGPVVVALSPVPGWLPLRWLGFLRHPPLGTEIVLYSGQLETVRSRLGEAGYSPGEIVLQPWGNRDFRITDRDGYYVRVSEGSAVPTSR